MYIAGLVLYLSATLPEQANVSQRYGDEERSLPVSPPRSGGGAGHLPQATCPGRFLRQPQRDDRTLHPLHDRARPPDVQSEGYGG